MNKFLVAVLLLLFVSIASATTISSEEIVMDLESKEAEVNVNISELTASSFSYITSADVESVNAYDNTGKLNCKVDELALGDEIICNTEQRENFIINMNYTFNNVVERNGQTNVFRYSHPIYRPTDKLILRVQLPRGTGLLEDNELNNTVVSPENADIGSNGRRIFVEWTEKPQIGDTLSYRISYESLQNQNDYQTIIFLLLGILIISGASYIYWKRRNTENIQNLYDDLSDAQIEVLDSLRENNGEMLQKDVVNESDYSKAKISGIVSELVEKEIIQKEKEGRSNKLKINPKYNI